MIGLFSDWGNFLEFTLKTTKVHKHIGILCSTEMECNVALICTSKPQKIKYKCVDKFKCTSNIKCKG